MYKFILNHRHNLKSSYTPLWHESQPSVPDWQPDCPAYFIAAAARFAYNCSTQAMVNQFQLFLHRCYNSIYYSIIALLIGFVLFSLMERIFQLTRARKPLAATLLDLRYVFLSMFYAPFIYLILAAVFGILSKGSRHDPNFTWVDFVMQFFIFLVVRDCLIYLRHRIFHTSPVWAFHSVHHSSEELNWLSAVRFHPAENLIEATGEILLFIVAARLGVDRWVLFVAPLFIAFYNYFIHSNLNWTFGPLRYVLVSPVLHRWHHSDTAQARDKNFAAMFSFIDLLMGTFYMPPNLKPETLGLAEQEKTIYPRTFAGQLLYPFRKH
jgi:sterol desaturase/sphingolipid hydroxylase (fatty acid hydroxylase superfamily)